MSLNAIKLGLLTLLFAAGFVAPAMATPMTEQFTLDTWQGSGSVSGNDFGTVTVKVDNSNSNNIDVTVQPANCCGFVNSGAGGSLDFYLADGSTPINSVKIDGLTTGFAAANTDTSTGITSASSYSAGGIKNFNYEIDCSNACGKGANNVYTGALSFIVEGVSLADFGVTPSEKGGSGGGYYFASDLCIGTSGSDPVTCGGTPGKTGPVTAENFSVPVPEPVTLSMFGVGLIGATALRRRKKA